MFMRTSKTVLTLLAGLALAGLPAAASAAPLQDGIELYSSGDVAGATAAWVKGAEEGDATAARPLSVAHGARFQTTPGAARATYPIQTRPANFARVHARIEQGGRDG